MRLCFQLNCHSTIKCRLLLLLLSLSIASATKTAPATSTIPSSGHLLMDEKLDGRQECKHIHVPIVCQTLCSANWCWCIPELKGLRGCWMAVAIYRSECTWSRAHQNIRQRLIYHSTLTRSCWDLAAGNAAVRVPGRATIAPAKGSSDYTSQQVAR